MKGPVREFTARPHRYLAYLLLITAGCAGHPINEHQPYPSALPSLATSPVAGDCPDVSGTYTNHVVEYWPQAVDGPMDLQGLFIPLYVDGQMVSASRKEARAIEAAAKSLYDFPAATVQLTLANERLEVRYVATDKTDATIAFSHGGMLTPGPRYTCAKFPEGPGLLFWPFLSSESFMAPVPVGMAGGSNTAVVLYKAVDGSLVVRLQAESGFTVLLVPYIRTDSEWRRFDSAVPVEGNPR
jgi:hypothetical protein